MDTQYKTVRFFSIPFRIVKLVEIHEGTSEILASSGTMGEAR